MKLVKGGGHFSALLGGGMVHEEIQLFEGMEGVGD